MWGAICTICLTVVLQGTILTICMSVVSWGLPVCGVVQCYSYNLAVCGFAELAWPRFCRHFVCWICCHKQQCRPWCIYFVSCNGIGFWGGSSIMANGWPYGYIGKSANWLETALCRHEHTSSLSQASRRPRHKMQPHSVDSRFIEDVHVGL